MKLPATLYRWDDEGAPTVTASTRMSDLINVLKKCLVEGYGSKAGLGWTLAFEDATNRKIAFRNSPIDGTGGYFQFASSNAADSGEMRFRGGMDMTDFDVFLRPTPLYGLHFATVTTRWYLIGTSRGFYLHVLPNSNLVTVWASSYEVNPMFFAGDIDSFNPNDPGAFIVTRGTGSSDATNGYQGLLTLSYIPNNDCIAMYATDGSDSISKYGIIGLDGISAFSTSYKSADEWVDANQNSSLTPAYIDNTVKSNVRSTLHPYRRGQMPGMFFAGVSGYSDSQSPAVRSINGVDYALVPCYSAGMLWISIGDWYD